MTILRKYKAKDVDMLMIAGTIIENAIANKAFLQSKRTTWGGTFFEDARTTIDNATQHYLGVDSAKEMRMATATVLSIQLKVITVLAEVKLQIMEDFKKDKPRRDELLKQLGFTTYLEGTQRHDQEALINLLFQFKTNLTAGVKKEIVNAGTAEASLDEITGYADQLRNSNVSQETFKGAKRSITAEGITVFNNIYDQVISIAKIAAKFHKDEQHMKDLFSFNKIKKALNAKPAKPGPDVPKA